MDTLFYQQLRRVCSEISGDTDNTAMIAKVISAYDLSLLLQNTARQEGLLALEEAIETLNTAEPTQLFLQQQIMLIVNGTDPQLVARIGMNVIVSNNYSSYDGLIILMYYKAACVIQCGEHPYVMQAFLLSMLPAFIQQAVQERKEENVLSKVSSKEEEGKKMISDLCKDEREVDSKDLSIINQTSLTILALSDRELQRLLREIENNSLTLAMKGFPGNVRKRIFDNVSGRLGTLLAEDMMYMGPVRRKDVEECCFAILKTTISLEEQGELAKHDFTITKVVVSLYENAKRENRELQDKYKELKELIDQIYNG